MLTKCVIYTLFFTSCMTIFLFTTFLYTNNRREYLRFHQRITISKLKPIAAISQFNVNKSSTQLQYKPDQYIWCVNHYGPNNQLKDFIKCCIIAMVNNYTLVIPPFYPHYGHPNRAIQWFDHFFDLGKLSSALKFIELKRLMEKFKINAKTVMINCYVQQYELVKDRTWYSRNALIHVQNHYKLQINFNQSINLTRSFDLHELSRKSKNCSSMFLHIHYTMLRQFFLTPNIYIKKVFEHLRRTPLIGRMASQLISQLPKLVIGKKNSQNNFKNLAVVHMRTGDHVVMSIPMYIKQILFLVNSRVNFTHLHIMCPYLNASESKLLTNNLPIPFTTSEHLLNRTNWVLDRYLFDVLEQEMAYQASVFMASPWTTYSATILMQKVYQDKGTVYVLPSRPNEKPFLVTKQNAKYFE